MRFFLWALAHPGWFSATAGQTDSRESIRKQAGTGRANVDGTSAALTSHRAADYYSPITTIVEASYENGKLTFAP